MALKTKELDVHDRVKGKVQHTRAGAFVVHDCYCDKCPLCIESTQRELAALAAARLAVHKPDDDKLAAIREKLHPTRPSYCAEVLDIDEARYLLARLDALCGEKFSDRVHIALQSRAKKAEAARLALQQELEETAARAMEWAAQWHAAEAAGTQLRQELEVLNRANNAAVYNQDKAREERDRAEHRYEQLRQDFQALPEQWLAIAKCEGPPQYAEAIAYCARGLADRLARPPRPPT